MLYLKLKEKGKPELKNEKEIKLTDSTRINKL